MRKGYKLLFALLATLLMIFATTSALAESLRFGTVKNTGSLNLRAAMSTDSKRIGSYKRGEWLQITGQSGDWYRVTGPDGRSGYVMRKYVYISAGAKGVVGIVDTSGSLNLRAAPNSSAKVIGSYPDGVPCILLSESGDWYHVSVDNQSGYFNANYVDKLYTTYSTDVATVMSENGRPVNLRKGPGKSYGVLKSIPNGSYAMILQEGNGWWKISVRGTVGYMDSSFLRDGVVQHTKPSGGSSSGGAGNVSLNGYALVNNPQQNQKLYLRQAASKSSKQLGAYGNGTRVTVLEHGEVWCKVQVEGVTGYMMTDYLQVYGLQGNAVAYVDHPQKTYVNLRNGPSQSSGKVLLRVPHGAKVTVLVPGSKWSQVQYQGKTGYMMTRFLD